MVLDMAGQFTIASDSKRTITADGSIELANGGRVVIITKDALENVIGSVGCGKSELGDEKLPVICQFPTLSL